MSDPITIAQILAKESDVGFNPNPTDTLSIDTAMSGMNNASTIDDIKVAVSDVVNAIQKSFESFINDQRTLHEQSILTVADEQITTTQSNNARTSEIVNGVRAVTAPISEDARQARQALSDGILGRISDNVTNFTSSLKPILPSLQTFGIAFATTGLGAMFMTNALISAIKFIFNNPLMFIGSLIGGSILYNMFKEPIDNFITKISDKLKEWLSDILATALTQTVKDSAKTIEGVINTFFNRFDTSTTLLFTNINGSIGKLQEAIDNSWKKINTDINKTIDKIFDTHFPNAIKKFFETFNTEIPNSIKVIDKALSESNEFQKIINTANGVSTALNNVCTLYNDNKEQIDKLINAFDGNKGLLLSTVASFFAPQTDNKEEPHVSDAEMSNIDIDVNDDGTYDNSNNKRKAVGDLTTPQTTRVVNSDTTPTTQPQNKIKDKLFGSVRDGLTKAYNAAEDIFTKKSSVDLSQLKTDTDSVVKEHVDKVNDAVKDVKKRIGDEKEELNKMGKKIEELKDDVKKFMSYIQLFMNRKTTESSSPNVVVNTLPTNINTEPRNSESHYMC